jgi:putative Holliday junction resolvase
MRYLAIDYGDKRIGLAVCDPSETIASPLKVLNRPKCFIKEITDIIISEEIGGLVLGNPLNMDGTKSCLSKLVERFAEKLKEKITIPIYFQDERLSTFAAEEKLVDIELTKKKRKERIDAIAAADILEAFLEQMKAK